MEEIATHKEKGEQKEDRIYYCPYCEFQTKHRQSEYHHVTTLHQKELQEKHRRKGLPIICFNCNTSYSDSLFVCENICSICNVCYYCRCFRDSHMLKHIVLQVSVNPFCK
jgi:hypothetical protein